MKTEDELFEVKMEEEFFEAKTEEEFFEAKMEGDLFASVALEVSKFLPVKNPPPLLVVVVSPFHLSPCSHPVVGCFAYAVCGG